MKTEVLIVGGGLAGLALARHLHREGTDFQLVEMRDRLGGRIKSAQHGNGMFDLGPAWFWPGQPRMEALVREAGLRVFEQFSTGDLMYEDERAQVQRGVGYSQMQGSLRIDGGIMQVVEALAAEVPSDRIHMSSSAAEIVGKPDHLQVVVQGPQGETTIEAAQTVLALPPRLVAERIAFTPPLAGDAVETMKGIATWMAGHAKAVAIYDTAFWRAKGLSGDAMSQAGPLVEIHDASPADVEMLLDCPAALFGFVGVPPHGRTDQQALGDGIVEQLGRLFGEQALSPQCVLIEDWVLAPATSTELDKQPLYQHPQYGLPRNLDGLMDGRLHLGSTETAQQFGGYLEGALEAAENVAARLLVAEQLRG